MAALAALVNPAFNHEGANDSDVSALRQSADAGIHALRRSRGGHAGKRRTLVFQLQRGHDLGQVRLPVRARHSGAVARSLHGVALYPEIQGADADGFARRRRVSGAIRKTAACSAASETPSKSSRSWSHGSLENAIETADSMRSRGYGLPGRTAFSIYRFDDRDKTALAWLIFCGAYLVSGWMAGGTYFRYYPTVKAAAFTPMTVSFMLVLSRAGADAGDSRPKGGQAVERLYNPNI